MSGIGRFVAMGRAVLLLAAASAAAGPRYWDGGASDIAGDGNGASAGGAGAWNTTLLNWDAGASPHVAWDNAGNDTAVFGGTAGTVTAGTGIAVGGLQFDTAGYTVQGSALAFDAAGDIAAHADATIRSVLQGSAAIAKAGAATLTLNGSAANTFNGGLVLNGGTLLADFANLAAPTDLIDGGNSLALGGGALKVKGKSTGTTTQNLGNVTVNAGGGQVLGDRNGGAGATINLGTLTATAGGGSLLAGAGGTSANAPAITTATDKDATGIYGGRVAFFDGTANTGYDWATTVSGSPPYALSPFSGYTALPASGGAPGVNYKMTVGTTLGGSFSVNTLKLEAPTGDLSNGVHTLTIEGGGLLFSGSTARNIVGAAGATRLTAGNGSGAYDLVVHQYNSGNSGLTISAVIGNNGANAVSLVKAGTGRLFLTGANTYSGRTYVNAGFLDFGTIALGGFGGGAGRNIHVAAGAVVRRNALDNAFLNRLVETADEITVMTGTTGNNLDFGSGTGASLPNAFLGNWAGNSAKAEYSGTLAPANNTYRLGTPSSAGLLGIVGALTGPRSLVVGGNRVELTAANAHTGDTVIRTGGRLFLGNNLALQNSALDTGAAGGPIAGALTLSAGNGVGKITGSSAADSPVLGGLKGSRNLVAILNQASPGNNASAIALDLVTNLTLNPGAGVTNTYFGILGDFAPGLRALALTKTGAGTQILAATNGFTGPVTVQGGTLALTRLAPTTNVTVAIYSGAVLRLDVAVTNAVTNLILNGVSQALGVYDAANAAPYLDGIGSLEVIDLDTDDDGMPDSYERAHTSPPSATALDPGDDLEFDGLTNLQEYQIGTDPNDEDTDNDTLLDGPELAGVGGRPPTSPTKADTDGDGLSDGVESHTGVWAGASDTGTNPADADTDDDGLRDGAESNTGLYLSATDTGSNPFLTDTDGDGAGDWYEVAAAYSNPVDPASKPAIPYPLPKPDGSTGATNKRVKVFILSGQSNMVGQGNVDPTNTPGTLATIVKQLGKFPNLLDTGGNWSVRSDVIYKGVVSATATGGLSVGQGSGAGAIGPELGFGHVMGYCLDEPVLVLKTSEGGQSLGYDFLPPGSPRFTNGTYTYAGYGDSPSRWLTGATPVPDASYGGDEYDKCVAAAKGVLTNFNTLYPQYAAQGYEIAGFGWFQGWNDIVDSVYPSRYETNLARFITSIRADFNATNVPFVIAACGFSGWSNASAGFLAVVQAQFAVSDTNKYPGFAGTVKTMETRGYWREVAESPVDQGYHYNRNAETFMLVGDALGRGMIELLSAAPTNNDYAAWAAGFPGAALGDPNADFDGDGARNNEERIWGLNPTNPASRQVFSSTFSVTTGAFSYTRRVPALTGYGYTVWTSTNMETWVEDAGAIQTPGAPVADVETVAVSLSLALRAEPKLFVRLRAAPN